MSGIIGAVGGERSRHERLEAAFRKIWPNATIACESYGFIAGHAFDKRAPVIAAVGRISAVDGERSLIDALYREHESATSEGQRDARRGIEPLCGVGNIVEIAEGTAQIIADPTGTVPLYFVEHLEGLYFSNLLRPLADAIAASADPVGIAQLMRFGYTIHDRTPFAGIRRLLAGQRLRWNHGRGIRLEETSRLWSGFDPALGSASVATERLGCALDATMARIAGHGSGISLMMSAGWDSRTLLAAAVSGSMLPRVHCYSHGDLQSRELAIAHRLCDDLQVPWHAEPLDANNYDVDALSRAVARTENVVFPHWHRAGRLLAGRNDVVIAGVFGEMLGGRYWSAHAKSGASKAATLFPMLLGAKGAPMESDADALAAATSLFTLSSYTHSWTTQLGDRQSEMHTLSAINNDITRALERYQQRGATGLDQLAEAYQGEHIGSRYCNVQLLSTRAYTQVAFPLADPALLEIATRTPLRVRIQNSVNRRIVMEREPRLLRRPMGATLAPASSPIVVQEASRVARKLFQMGTWSAHFLTRGAVKAPRLAWANYEFLREGIALRQTVESLSSSVWNTPALLNWVERVERGTLREQMLDPAELLGKMVTVDHLTR